MVKDDLCKAFCDEVQLREVPAGLAVATGFDSFSGDTIGFYIVGPDTNGRYRIQDDGLTVLNLESAGADIEIASRAEVFHNLLQEYGFLYDNNEHTLESHPLVDTDVASSALRFVALLLRLQDLLFMVQERAVSTFKEEVTRQFRANIGQRVEILENDIVHEKLSEYPVDIVFKSKGRDPVALFFGTSDVHLLEAELLDFAARYEANVNCKIVALLEQESSVSQKRRQHAANRLAVVASYKGDEQAAIKRIEREIFGETLH